MAIRPPVKWYGGKHYLARWIIEHFPPHRIYLEPFGGGASVLLNKEPCDVETYNDLDRRITRLFRVLREHGDEFVAKAQLIPYSQIEFEDAKEYPEDASEIDMALCDFIRWRQSFAGRGESWSYTTSRARGRMAGDVNAWWTSIDGLKVIVDRLRRVQIISQSAFDAIPRFDHPEAVIYCDPPYVHSTRGEQSRKVYHTEMTDQDHLELARLLRNCQGHVIVSGYDSGVYAEAYSGWRKVTKEIANHASNGKEKRRETECLWLNF